MMTGRLLVWCLLCATAAVRAAHLRGAKTVDERRPSDKNSILGAQQQLVASGEVDDVPTERTNNDVDETEDDGERGVDQNGGQDSSTVGPVDGESVGNEDEKATTTTAMPPSSSSETNPESPTTTPSPTTTIITTSTTISTSTTTPFQPPPTRPTEPYPRRTTASPASPPVAPDLDEALCTFGSGDELLTCDWDNVENVTMLWRLSTGETANWLGGPPSDGGGDATGGYAFVETSHQPMVNEGPLYTSAMLRSSQMFSTGAQGTCFRFSYLIEGLSAAGLRIALSTDGAATNEDTEGRLLWETRAPTRGAWQQAEVLYTVEAAHTLVLEAIPVEQSDPLRIYRGYIAVDQLQTLPGIRCQGFCTFAAGFCDWGNEQGDDMDWSLSGSRNPSTGPSQDSSGGGGYAFIDSSFPRRPGDLARITSALFPPTDSNNPMCMKFWFHMFGPVVGTLRVLLRRFQPGLSSPSREIWSLSGSAGNAWYMAEVTVSSVFEFQMVFEASVGGTSMSDIAVDDIAFTSGPCSVAPQVAAPVPEDCNFEVDECGWMNSMGRGNVLWERISGRTLSPALRRPASVSAAENEYFLSLSRSLPQPIGGMRQLLSREVNGSAEPRCLSFWYLMHEPFIDVSGPSLGLLRVLVQTKKAVVPVWQLYNNQGPGWQYGQTPITEASTFRIIFEGTWGPNRASGAIAIDDIAFYEGQCRLEPNRASVYAVDCSFEGGLCGWHNRSRHRADGTGYWQAASTAHRPSQLRDRTFGMSDGYIFFDIFNTNQKQSEVRLVSSSVKPKDETPFLCFTFWFAAFGAVETTHLSVLRSASDDSNPETLWELTAQGLDTSRPTWTPAQVLVDSFSTFTITLAGKASNGGFAVDDLRLLPGPCKTRPREAEPRESTDH